MNKLKQIVLLGFAASIFGLCIGCGAGNQSVERPSAKEVSDLVSLRKIFDRVHGDQSQLTPTEKQQFLDYSKDQEHVDKLWSWMTNPRGGGVTETKPKPFAMGPNGGIYPPNSNQGG